MNIFVSVNYEYFLTYTSFDGSVKEMSILNKSGWLSRLQCWVIHFIHHFLYSTSATILDFSRKFRFNPITATGTYWKNRRELRKESRALVESKRSYNLAATSAFVHSHRKHSDTHTIKPFQIHIHKKGRNESFANESERLKGSLIQEQVEALNRWTIQKTNNILFFYTK